jgi:hypothetical protein
VWARGRVAVTECPKSYISARSLAWLEMFAAFKALGYPDAQALEARDAEAMMLLERELVEVRNGDK